MVGEPTFSELKISHLGSWTRHRVGGSLTASRLPHHRTYGSVYGGSECVQRTLSITPHLVKTQQPVRLLGKDTPDGVSHWTSGDLSRNRVFSSSNWFVSPSYTGSAGGVSCSVPGMSGFRPSSLEKSPLRKCGELFGRLYRKGSCQHNNLTSSSAAYYSSKLSRWRTSHSVRSFTAAACQRCKSRQP